MIIPASPRYDYVISKVHDFLKEFNITTLPLDPFSIIKELGCALITYSSLESVYNCDNKTIADIFQSKDGFTLLINNKYVVIYNDKASEKNLIPFTLIHEIGHIYLRHLKDFNETKISENGLSDLQYRIIEEEADTFARNLYYLSGKYHKEP